MELDELISPRIKKHCFPLFVDKYYKHAVREAMTQVELALKEKGMVRDNRYGVNLVRSVLDLGGKQKIVKLRIPLGDELQEQAKILFEGAFSYYRNYATHDGSKIDERICMRILILASELLELIDASSLSYSDLGGIDGLLKSGVFSDKNQLLGVLSLLSGYHLPDGDADGLRDDLFEKFGAGDEQITAVLELDLARYQEVDYIPDAEELKIVNHTLPDTIGWFELTDLGWKIIDEIKKTK